MARILIGTSGWHYDSWRGPFFPEGLPLKSQLQYYASQFPTTELNGVFYRTPTPEAVKSWRDQTGKDFVFAWKASKFITHWKRLSDKSVNSLELLENRLSLLGKQGRPDPVSTAAAISGRCRTAGIVLETAIEETPIQFRISSSELVFAKDIQAALRPKYLALHFRSSRRARAVETHRRFRLHQGPRPGRALQGALSCRRCSRTGAGESGRGKNKGVTSTSTSTMTRRARRLPTRSSCACCWVDRARSGACQ